MGGRKETRRPSMGGGGGGGGNGSANVQAAMASIFMSPATRDKSAREKLVREQSGAREPGVLGGEENGRKQHHGATRTHQILRLAEEVSIRLSLRIQYADIRVPCNTRRRRRTPYDRHTAIPISSLLLFPMPTSPPVRAALSCALSPVSSPPLPLTLSDLFLTRATSTPPTPHTTTHTHTHTHTPPRTRQVRHWSKESSLVFMLLPAPAAPANSTGNAAGNSVEGNTISARKYMSWLDALSRKMPPMIFVRGNHQDVLTMYC